MPLGAGTRLGPYEIVAAIAGGGMGEVYRARDIRLGRTVAIKVLPATLAHDPERQQRFAREAKAIAALNHPHICTLHAFERAPSSTTRDPLDFLVMECLEGETLAARLQRAAPSGLPLAETLSIAVQIADALAAAHKQGIVHRDLKPGNIMLTRGGSARTSAPHVKLLDFGLAKLRSPGSGPGLASAATATDPLTGEGTLVGTLQYMAPEQLEGKDADARADLFALGAIVYEMVTGRRAFEADSQASLIAAILEHDPPPLAERAPLTPQALERIVRTCLAKDMEERWDSAHALADAFRWIAEDSGPGRVVALPHRPRRRWWIAAAALLSLAPLAGALWWLAAASTSSLPPMRTIPLTSYPGEERDPALSPDGEQVAFTWRGPSGDGTFKLFVKLVDGGEPLLIHDGAGDVFTPAWSPDGRQLAFIRHVDAAAGQPNDGLFVTSALGGAARLLGTFRGPHVFNPAWTHGLSWSPDGRTLAVSHKPAPDQPSGIHALSLATGEVRPLTAPPSGYELGDYYPRFSPDGRSVAFLRGDGVATTDIHTVPVVGGEPHRVTTRNANSVGLEWAAGGRRLLFGSSRESDAGWSALWSVPAAGGTPELLGTAQSGQWPTLSSDGRRLVYVRTDENSDLWRIGGPTAPEHERTPRPWVTSTWLDWDPEYSPDGERVAFTSHRSGASEIWIANSDGTSPTQISFLGNPITGTKGWSPDGKRLAFMSLLDGTFHIYIVESSGGIARRLSDSGMAEFAASWSRDGRWIYFNTERNGRREILKAPVAGGEPIQVTRHGGFHARESPDRRFLYFSKSGPSGGTPGIWRMPADGGDEVRVVDSVAGLDWAMFDHGLCYVQRGEGPGATIRTWDFETGEIRTVVSLDEAPWPTGLAVSPDGRWIVYVRSRRQLDLMLVENFR